MESAERVSEEPTGPARSGEAAEQDGVLPVLPYDSPLRWRMPDKYLGIIYALAAALFIAYGVAGVGSDRIRLPLPKKIALTLATVIVLGLVLRAAQGRSGRRVLATVSYACCIGLFLMMMWFMN